VEVLEESLPVFAKAQSFWGLVAVALGRRHDWLSIVLVYSKRLPRATRVAVIVTGTVTVMSAGGE
jgi:hypothetical protein